MNGLKLPDYVVIGGYFALVIVIAVYFSRYLRQMKQYFTGGNRIPWWLSGVSFYMTGFTVYAFMNYSEMAYKYGFVAVTLFLCAGLPILLGARLLAARWRRARIASPTEFLESRYSPALQQILAWANIPVRLIDNGLRIFATGWLVSRAMGFDLTLGILLCGLISLATAFAGGLWAAMVTDFVQFVVQTAAVAILVPLAIDRVGGIQGIGAGAREGFFAPWSGAGEPYTLFVLLSWLVLTTISYNSSFALVQRYYCVPDERSAKKAGILAGVLTMASAFVFFLPALLAPQFLTGMGNAKDTYPELCKALLPPGMMGIVVAAMFAATMSSLSSEYNVLASVLTNDVYKRHISPQASPRRILAVGMGTTLALGLLPMGISLYLASDPTADRPFFSLMKGLFDVFLAPTALPILGGLLWRRLNMKGAFAGFCAGLATGIGFFIFQRVHVLPSLAAQGIVGVAKECALQDWGAWTVFANAAVTIAAMVVVTLLTRRSVREQARSATFFSRLDTPIAADAPVNDPAAEAGPSPFFIIGFCTVGVGALLIAAGLMTSASLARSIDLGMGAALALVGFAIWRPWRRVREVAS